VSGALRATLVVALLAAVALAAAVRPSRADTTCTALPGGRIVLESDAVDPDVFLWDSRSRLVDYAAGEWGNTRAIFAHTVLAPPGTQAMVVACVPGVAHPKFSTGDEDAIGVKVTSGRYRGRYGWVLSSDIRVHRGASASVIGSPKEFKR
jgi:hypothetical protein